MKKGRKKRTGGKKKKRCLEKLFRKGKTKNKERLKRRHNQTTIHGHSKQDPKRKYKWVKQRYKSRDRRVIKRMKRQEGSDKVKDTG